MQRRTAGFGWSGVALGVAAIVGGWAGTAAAQTSWTNGANSFALWGNASSWNNGAGPVPYLVTIHMLSNEILDVFRLADILGA